MGTCCSSGTCCGPVATTSDVFYGNASPDRLDEGFPITRIGDPSGAGRVLLYQLSIGSGVADIFRDRPERKFVNYHNITPADLLEAWIPAGRRGGAVGEGPAAGARRR